MRTTIILNPEIKKQAQLKALQEGRSLSEIVNSMLSQYVNGVTYEQKPIKTASLKETLHTGILGTNGPIDRDFIYDELD
ncbi:hypothetical protein KAZ57_01895 [Patescibacteria group bacterium]|nr:hypothetical protein [Patescibacteria group bacterium]